MLLWLFILIPIIEIFLLIEVGSVIGVFPTILMILATAIVGLAMLKVQGLQTFIRFQKALAQQQMPALELIEGLILLVSGALLLTPGFFTDAIGFLGLIRTSRLFIVRTLLAHSSFFNFENHNTSHKPRDTHSDYIEGKFRHRDEDD